MCLIALYEVRLEEKREWKWVCAFAEWQKQLQKAKGIL